MKPTETTDVPAINCFRRDWFTWAMIFASCLVVYFPALHGSFLWDDDGHVTKQSLRSLHGLWRIWADLGASQQYYPVLHSAFWVEWQLWGESLLGYHLVNILLHATASCLVVALARRLALPGAWLAGLVFALHPVCVESVAWISEQKNTLSTVFVLTASLFYLRFDETRTRRHYLFASLFFALALLTKSVAAMTSVALGIILWWKHGRLRWREDLLPLLPWIIVGAGAGLFTAWVERTYIGAQGTDFALNPGQRLLLAGRIPLFYLSKLVWPVDLAFIYPRWTPDTAVAWQWIFPSVLAALLAILWMLRTKTRGSLAATLAYLALLFPVLGFVNIYPFIFSFVADHFQYLASIALIIPASAALAKLFRATSPRLASIAAAGLLALFGTLTWHQSHVYRDSEGLYRHTLARNPDSWMVNNNLASAIASDPRRNEEALQYYRAAIAIKPNYPEAHFNAANILAEKPATMEQALGHYEAAIRVNPRYAEAHNNFGSLLAKLPNRLPDAIAHFQAAIKYSPEFVEAYNNLGTALARTPESLPKAIQCYRTAIKLLPEYAETHFNLGNALAKAPATRAEAIACFESAIRLKPKYAEAHVNMAFLLSQDPARRADAIAHYEAALRERPELETVKRALERLRQTPAP